MRNNNYNQAVMTIKAQCLAAECDCTEAYLDKKNMAHGLFACAFGG
jgi:hypothetical protein